MSTSFFARNRDHLTEDAAVRESKPVSSKYDGRQRLANTAEIDVTRIEADPQHREEFDETALQNLADSIRQHGQLQPIRVRWDEPRDIYVIIAGERRWRASQIAGNRTVQCVIVEGAMSTNQILREQIIENALREDLRATERARAYRDLMDAEGWNGKELAAQLQLVPSTVSRTLAILNLPMDLQNAIDDGDISIKAAIKAAKQPEKARSTAKKKKAKPGREWKISVDGYTVSVKARRILREDLLRQALNAALRAVEEATEAADKAA